MKQKIGLSIVVLALLAGCAPDFSGPDQVIDETLPDDIQQETAIIPNYGVSENEYQVLLPYRLSQSRGVTTNQVANRLDITTIENDLRRHSVDVFDPDTHYFQEGQQIASSELYSWLSRESDSSELGLNPTINQDADNLQQEEFDNPRYLSHILEQNYLVRNDDNAVQLAGISLGIAMKSNYRYQTEIGGPFYYRDIEEDDMLSEANRIANEVTERIRAKEGLQEVPIMIAIYREAARNELVPGSFVAKTVVQGGSTTAANWEAIDEQYALFPSTQGRNLDSDISATIEDLQSSIADFFPNYVGVIGEGFYQGDQLRKLTLEIPIEFYGQAEVVGFTQYVYGLLMESFQTHFDLEVNIKSSDRQESLIFREAGEEEPVVHIYQR
ncbi:Protein involved in sex pheromone biosynthesis [Amphibacillus marinus]|uniref:Protein involved in sex pheromone biosynthesis n=1 Tax=Amphibacillus marinus TaxID=872970 RepID=A0A1H8LIU6_9BACI|nr:CamS family sex pheromone protein [Amphibacillus marinus]SEO05027.1 Protein involved in sex pheromone biosynthesis [Amphibacillus marinus]